MVTLTTSEARKDFARMISRVLKGERILLTRHDGGVAAVVPVEDLQLLQSLEDFNDARAARASLADAEINGTVPWEQVKAELGL